MHIGDFKESYAADEALFRTPTARAWLGVLLGVLLAFPFLASDYLVYLANLVGVFAIAALGLNTLTGYTGQISLGHGAFMGVGAYASAILTMKLDGSRAYERLTYFSDYPGYKASNPVVSDDGRFIAFQLAKSSEAAGVGHGLFILDLDKKAATAR